MAFYSRLKYRRLQLSFAKAKINLDIGASRGLDGDMNHDLSLKTRRAVAKYGQDNCLEAYRMHFNQGEGARTIAATISCTNIRTTQAANAAIDAGRELHWAAKRSVQPSF